MQISLLHATYRAGDSAVEVRDSWYSLAACPDRVEHIFAFNCDDEVSAECAEIASGVAGSPTSGVTAVRNWNAAARRATGDLLIVIADDLLPFPHWDTEVERICGNLDPRRAAFVIKIRDTDADRSDLIRHPVLSRRYFHRFGLWHEAYEGHLVDNDFTLCAHRRNLVIDGRTLHFNHQDPHDTGQEWTDSQWRMLASQEVGYAVFEKRWPTWRRRIVRRYLVPRPGELTIRHSWRVTAALISVRPYVLRCVPQVVLRRIRKA